MVQMRLIHCAPLIHTTNSHLFYALGLKGNKSGLCENMSLLNPATPFKAIRILLILLFACCTTGRAGVDDTEYWVHVGAKHKLDDIHGFKISSEHRIKDDGDEYSSNNLDLGYSTKLSAVWTYSINMRVEGKKKNNGNWKEEWRPNFNATAKKVLGPFALSNRSRLEWRILEGASDLARFRNKVEIAYLIPQTQIVASRPLVVQMESSRSCRQAIFM